MILAYVDRGMWIAEHVCRHAIALEPCGDAILDGIDWPKDTTKLVCACGAIESIQMPPNRDEIESVLNKRKIVNRNWRPHESVADLRIENAVHHEDLIS